MPRFWMAFLDERTYVDHDDFLALSVPGLAEEDACG